MIQKQIQTRYSSRIQKQIQTRHSSRIQKQIQTRYSSRIQKQIQICYFNPIYNVKAPIATKPRGLKKILCKMRRANSGHIPQEPKQEGYSHKYQILGQVSGIVRGIYKKYERRA